LAWTVEVSDFAERQLRKLDRTTQRRLLDWLEDRIDGCKNPRHFGEALKGDLAGLWRYRVGDYRIICEIQDGRLLVLALAVGHRREVYSRGKK
jgi:mRNA interferase RelE/StbE